MSKENEHGKKRDDEDNRKRRRPTVSARLTDGTLVELLYHAEEKRTSFALSKEGKVWEAKELTLPDGSVLVPYSAGNNLITHRAILLPSEPSEYGTETELRATVQEFIHRYVDLPADFEELATHYVCFSWRFDDFPDLPYLRVQGDYGSGKSRFLRTVGSIAYRPIFASGASTVSPLFRILDSIGGTLIFDEADFRFSDEKADVVKILNNGNTTGFPVLRTETSPQGEFNPRAFHVFGPKLIATRGPFDDPALESRCISTRLGGGKLRRDIPINLPAVFSEEALLLRNRLLLYRLRVAGRGAAPVPQGIKSLEPRVAQVFTPLISSVDDPAARDRLLAVAKRTNEDHASLRSYSIEAEVVATALALRATLAGAIPIRAIAEEISREESGTPFSPRAVGAILRRLGLFPRKRQGNYILPSEEANRLDLLAERYGLLAKVDLGDVVDEQRKGEMFGHETE